MGAGVLEVRTRPACAGGVGGVDGDGQWWKRTGPVKQNFITLFIIIIIIIGYCIFC